MFAGSVQTADGEWAQILTQPLVATDQQNNRSLDTTRLCPVASILSLFLAQRALTTSEKHQTKKRVDSRSSAACQSIQPPSRPTSVVMSPARLVRFQVFLRLTTWIPSDLEVY